MATENWANGKLGNCKIRQREKAEKMARKSECQKQGQRKIGQLENSVTKNGLVRKKATQN